MRLKFGDQVKRLQRPDMIYSKNISQIQSGLIALQIQQRTQLDNDKVLNMMRSHPFFYQHTNEFMIECCKVAKYEVLQKNLRLFRKGFGKLDRLVIILTGDLGVYLNSDGLKIELTSIRHFGSLCFILGSDYFADMYNIYKNRPDIEVLCKTQCIAATIDRAYFTQNLMTQEISKMTKEITMLYQFKIFNQITYGHIRYYLLRSRKFYANSLKQTFSTLDVIYTQNSAAQLVYLVLSGIFELREEKDGAVSSISIVSPGQLIGDQEIVKQIPLRQQTAYCISDEGIVLMFDSSYYITHMLPIIKHNFEQKVIRKKPTLSLHQTFYQRKLSQDEIKLQVKLPEQIFQDKQVIVNKEYYTRYKKMNKKVKPQHEFLSHSNSKRRNYQSFYQAQDFSQQVGTSGRNLFSNQKLTSLKNEQSPFRLTKIKSLSILINKFQ